MQIPTPTIQIALGELAALAELSDSGSGLEPTLGSEGVASSSGPIEIASPGMSSSHSGSAVRPAADDLKQLSREELLEKRSRLRRDWDLGTWVDQADPCQDTQKTFQCHTCATMFLLLAQHAGKCSLPAKPFHLRP